MELTLPSPCVSSPAAVPSVHPAHAAGHAAALLAGERRLPVCCPANSAEAHRPGHQHPAARHRPGAGHPVTAARLHQVNRRRLASGSKAPAFAFQSDHRF